MTRPDEPIYEVSTTKKSLLAETTVIKKYHKDGEPEYMGLVELYARTDVCKVWGKDMPPKSDGFFKNGRSFVASDGQKYTWKQKSNGNQELTDQSKNVIATWERAHTGFFSGRPSAARLSIAEAGVSIADDIVVTFVDVEQWTRINQAAAAAAA
ncbi:hypothetical protein VNI00_008862 [Paramarasmius palmivorus]|uniref:DUF6593 domain-containing protein n=1 Tax=Paramarasmius palmivorus TaxID=297713 RepID=A0AAW0CSI0_9AGAR